MSGATQLMADILRIPTRGDGDNCFLVREDDGYTLIDVGWKSAPKVIGDALECAGHGWADVRRIVITHAHPDHVSGLADAVARSQAEVLIHELDAPWLSAGRVPRSGRAGALGRVIDALPLLHWQPVTATRTLADNEAVGSLRVIHTPGHSPGHIVLLHEPSRALLVGDAVFHRGGLSAGSDALAADPAVRNDSYARLPRDIVAVGFAHGAPLGRDDIGGFVDWLDGVAKPSGHNGASE